MKKRILNVFLAFMLVTFLSRDVQGQDLVERATQANIEAAVTYWTDFHKDFLVAAKLYAEGDMIAIPKFLDDKVAKEGVFREDFLSHIDTFLYYTTLASTNVLAELKTILGLDSVTRGEIDTGNITLSDGSTIRVIITLNRPSTGGAKGSRNHRDHYEDIITVTRINGVTQSFSYVARTFVDALGGNDAKLDYLAKVTADSRPLSTAKVEGFVAASNVAVVTKNEYIRTVYTAANTVSGTISYKHSDSEGYTLADTAKIASVLGATGMTASSLGYLRATACPTEPPTTGVMTVTYTVAGGATVTVNNGDLVPNTVMLTALLVYKAAFRDQTATELLLNGESYAISDVATPTTLTATVDTSMLAITNITFTARALKDDGTGKYIAIPGSEESLFFTVGDGKTPVPPGDTLP